MSIQHSVRTTPTPIYGLMAQFDSEHDLLHAARAAREEGYRNMDAYSPVPVEGLAEAIGLPRSRVPLLVLCGGIIGCVTGLALQYWIMVKAYPVNVGGRPLASWAYYIPPAFETTILFAALTAVFGMFALNKLPQPYHPVFNVPSFSEATQDKYFLCIEAADPRFDVAGTRAFLESLHPLEVSNVEH